MATAKTAGSRADAPLITFVSASGGVGKSTLAFTSAWLAARTQLRCGLVDADLQFGDLGYWAGIDASVLGLEAAPACEPYAVADCLGVYRAPAFPECAEEVAEQVAACLPALRAGHDVVFADTGQFWSGLTGELVCASDLVMVVFDSRQTSLVGAVRAQELLARMGIAASRCVYVYNRWTSRARLSKRDAADALQTQKLHCVPDGKSQVETLCCAGELEELIDARNPLVQGVDSLLETVLSRVGCAYEKRVALRRRGLFA